MYNPYRQIEILQQALESGKSRIGFLLGAGCPVSICVQDGDNSAPLIPNIEGLTKKICEKLKETEIVQIVERIPIKKTDITIEDILSHVRLLAEVVGEGEIDNFTKKGLDNLEKQICINITDCVSKDLPESDTPYHHLASWINGILRNNPVEIFTPNYDLLVESALESKNIPYFDGFVGSRRAFFDLHAIEHEILPPRWVKLWKLHGSINWWNDPNGNIFRGHSEQTQNKQMIYPSHLKYEESRRMPYHAMQDRLGHFLAKGQAVLVTCGYSFADKHLNSIIIERLLANPSAICFGLLHSGFEKYPEALACAKKCVNLSLIARDGAFHGGQQLKWNIEESTSANHYDFCVEKNDTMDDATTSVICKIGDFQVLGQFLLNQIGYSHSNEGVNYAD